MGFGTRADDWKVLSVGQLGAALIVSAAIFLFDFHSAKAGLTARFRLSGTGKGLGANISELGDPGDWDDIDSSDPLGQPFSVWDLDRCPGHLASIGAGAVISLGAVYISAGPKTGFRKPFFSVQNVGGFGLGAGASAFSITGEWRFSRVSNNVPPSDWIA